MDWNPLHWFTKANPAQEQIYFKEGTNVPSDASVLYGKSFDIQESANRGTNLIVSAAASLDFDVKEKVVEGMVVGIRQKTIINLLNFKPNPYQSTQEFRTHIYTDFILEGNIFIYFDGVHLYHLPAANMVVHPDPKTFVKGYQYNSTTEFKPDEIIHIKDLSATSVYRGTSRLSSASKSLATLSKMQTFQDQFFENGAVLGIVIETDNTLSQLAKERTILNWMTKYSAKNGAKRPAYSRPAPQRGTGHCARDG